MVGRVSRLTYQVHVVIMVNPHSFKSERSRSSDGIVVGRVSRLTYQVHVVIMVNPRSFKSERSRSSC